MNEHTRRVMLRAISMIEAYRAHEIGLRYLVDSLEASMGTLEEKLPREFDDRWYDDWGALEQFVATGSEQAHGEEIRLATDGIIALLKETTSSMEIQDT